MGDVGDVEDALEVLGDLDRERHVLDSSEHLPQRVDHVADERDLGRENALPCCNRGACVHVQPVRMDASDQHAHLAPEASDRKQPSGCGEQGSYAASAA
eukprot:3509075-Prymnesium_polylepis.1